MRLEVYISVFQVQNDLYPEKAKSLPVDEQDNHDGCSQTDLHLEKAKGLPVYEQDNHNGCEGHISAKNAQRGNADKVAEERLLADLEAGTEDDGRQKKPATSCHPVNHVLLSESHRLTLHTLLQAIVFSKGPANSKH